MSITRRTALLAGLGGLAGALAGCGGDDSPAAGSSNSGTFTSRLRGGASTGWTVLYPPGHDRGRLPVLVALHGRGGHHTDTYRSLRLDSALADAVAQGTAPFAIASVDGGDHDYWHPRRASDAAGMVTREFLPLLARHGLDVRRPAFLGWSMGGYGALYLGATLGPDRVSAVVAESPAVWHEAGQSVQGAFDDAADFDAHSVVGNRARLAVLGALPLRIDCGDRDGFAPVTRDLRASLRPTPAGGIEPGGHDSSFWRSQGPAQLRFVGRHL